MTALLGRSGEIAALEAVLASARLGTSGVVVLRGEPGSGKTALLDHLAAGVGAMRVLRARGVESESEVPFAGLHALLQPVLGRLGDIPARQASALAGALALGPIATGDRFVVGAATLSLLAAAADEQPLCLLVDDCHWLDAASADALVFAARRLVADPIAALLATRDGEPSALDESGLPTITLGGLDLAAAAELLGRSRRTPRREAERLHAATGGNPLALLELAGAAVEPLVPGAPIDVPARIADAFGRRLEACSHETRRALALAAACSTGDLSAIVAACARCGLAAAALEQAEEADLVRLSGSSLEFRHPLLRSVAYAGVTPAERREAHRALAATLPDRDADQRAWHLAAAALGRDDAAAAALEGAGRRAGERRADRAASSAFERAALLGAPERRAALLYQAAASAWRAGLAERALRLLDELDDGADWRATRLRGLIAAQRGPLGEGRRLLGEAARAAAPSDPAAAAEMLARAAVTSFYACDIAGMRAAADEAGGLAASEPAAAFYAAVATGVGAVMSGEGRAGTEAMREAVGLIESTAELRDDAHALSLAVLGPLFLRDDAGGRQLIARAVAVARADGALGVLASFLHLIGRDRAASDRWREAEALFREAIDLGRETGGRVGLALALAWQALLEARQGREPASRAHAAEALVLSDEAGIANARLWALTAMAELEVSLGRPAAALPHLEALAAQLSALGLADPDLDPAPELVDVLLRLGRPEEARALIGPFDAAARAKGQPWSLARSERALGQLADSPEQAEGHFEIAAGLHARTPDAFEAARTQLRRGEALRRARRRADARSALREAFATFEELGAHPWADLAAAELRATGETARRRDPSTLDDLTPRELQVALALSDGRTTREAAAGLFLSPKTVEYHLRHVYRKLGIASRAELGAAFSAEPESRS